MRSHMVKRDFHPPAIFFYLRLHQGTKSLVFPPFPRLVLSGLSLHVRDRVKVECPRSGSCSVAALCC